MNLKSVSKAVYGEVIAKSSGDFKAGVLKAVTSERRLVLALPQGANQVDFQFHPVDIALIEVRPRI